MRSLVSIRNNKPITDTLIISECIGNEHRAVMALLKSHSNTEILSTFEMLKVSNGGRPVDYAILDELQATFLVTLMRNSEKVVSFKQELTKQFFKQREAIQQLISQQQDPNWMNVRKDGKQVYFQKTDVIKDFIDYAINQGSKSAKMYYMNFAKMENKALFIFEQKYPNMREVLTIRQLMQVSIADDIIEKAIKEGMEQELFYKDIFKESKKRIIKYVEIIGKSPILGLEKKENK